MKNLRYVLFVILLEVVLELLPVFAVYAVTNPNITMKSVSAIDIINIESWIDSCNEEISDKVGVDNILEYTCNTMISSEQINIVFSLTSYNSLSKDEKYTVMDIVFANIDKYSISTISRNKLYSFIISCDRTTATLARQLGSDTKKDFPVAYSAFRPFSGMLGNILGIIAVLFFIIIGFSMVFDIVYLVSPMLQISLNSAMEKGKRNKPFLVSKEACRAVQEAESSTEYVNPLMYWLRSRVKYILIASVCLLYLVSGQLFNIVGDFIDYLKDVGETFSNT